MKRMKVGIIGLGRSGRDIHGQYLNTARDKHEIVAACDILKKRRKQAAEEYGCAVYADYKKMFVGKDLDLLINALPSY